MNVIRLDELKVKVERTEGGRKQRRLGGSGELKMLNTASLTAGWGPWSAHGEAPRAHTQRGKDNITVSHKDLKGMPGENLFAGKWEGGE